MDPSASVETSFWLKRHRSLFGLYAALGALVGIPYFGFLLGKIALAEMSDSGAWQHTGKGWLGLLLLFVMAVGQVLMFLYVVGLLRANLRGLRGVEVVLRGDELIIRDHDAIRLIPPSAQVSERRFQLSTLEGIQINKINVNGVVFLESLSSGTSTLIDLSQARGRIPVDELGKFVGFLRSVRPGMSVVERWQG